MLRHAVETGYLRVLPHDGGIILNDIPARLEFVARNDYRVDLEHAGRAAFLVEHILGCLLLAGITSAKVYGTSKEYDRSRQTHRDAEARGLPPSAVIGNPYGTLDAKLYEALLEAGVGKPVHERRVGIKKEEYLDYPRGSIKVSPSDEFRVRVISGELSYDFEMGDSSKAREVVNAETPYLGGLTRQSIPHVVGDVVGDIMGIGGINRAEVEIHPGREYHRVTIGVLRKLEKVSLD